MSYYPGDPVYRRLQPRGEDCRGGGHRDQPGEGVSPEPSVRHHATYPEFIAALFNMLL